MGFDVIRPRPGGGTDGDVIVGIRNNSSGHRLVISISTTLLARLGDGLGAAGRRVRLEVSAGTEEDAGWLRLRPDEGGYLLRAASRRSQLSFALRAPAGAPNTLPPHAATHRIDTSAGALLVKLPFNILSVDKEAKHA